MTLNSVIERAGEPLTYGEICTRAHGLRAHRAFAKLRGLETTAPQQRLEPGTMRIRAKKVVGSTAA